MEESNLDSELYDMIIRPFEKQYKKNLKDAKSEQETKEIKKGYFLAPEKIHTGNMPDFGTLIVPLDDNNFLHLNRDNFRLRSGSFGKFSREQLLIKRSLKFPIYSKDGQQKKNTLYISGRLGQEYPDTLEGLRNFALGGVQKEVPPTTSIEPKVKTSEEEPPTTSIEPKVKTSEEERNYPKTMPKKWEKMQEEIANKWEERYVNPKHASTNKKNKEIEEEYIEEIPEEQLISVNDAIEKAFDELGGSVKIFDRFGHEICTAHSKQEAMAKLRDLAREGKTSYIGKNKNEIVMVSHKMTVDNLPMVEAQLMKYIGKLDPNVIDDAKIIYNIQELIKRGFKKEDYEKIAKLMASKKLTKALEKTHTEAQTGAPSRLHRSVKKISITDIDRMKEFIKNRK